MNVTITISYEELSYLRSIRFLKNFHISPLGNVETKKSSNSHISMIIPINVIEEYRTAFTEQLAKVGFDNEYNLTPEGKILENLIDKFYLENDKVETVSRAETEAKTVSDTMKEDSEGTKE